MIKENETVSADRVIELKELRIGNILSYKDSYVHVTLLSIDADDEYEDTIGFCLLGTNSKEKSDWNRALAADLNRVALTPEILEKCGFELIRQEYFLKDGISIQRRDEEGYYLIETQTYDEYLIYIGKPFRHLHQLQNLIFALTGEELNVHL